MIYSSSDLRFGVIDSVSPIRYHGRADAFVRYPAFYPTDHGQALARPRNDSAGLPLVGLFVEYVFAGIDGSRREFEGH